MYGKRVIRSSFWWEKSEAKKPLGRNRYGLKDVKVGLRERA
jgi:hypothetical protein